MREENDKKQDEEEVDANAEVVAPKPELSPQELGKKLALAERILYGRVVVGAILFCIFAALDVSAVLTGKMQEQGGILLVVLVAAILALPRQVLPPKLVNQLPLAERREKIDRVQRIEKWLVWARVVFFLSALFLFALLPEIV
jgi:tetrahydromethanopterin S-methyltransferase subunit G